MKIDILTIFPQMFKTPFAESIVKRAIDDNKVEINIHDLRDWTSDNHRSVDDRPFGGGAGMIMRVDVIDKAVQSLKSKNSHIVLLDTKGEFLTQTKSQKLSKQKHLILIAGHYEGVDHRVHKHIADEVISIGPYVLTGGELPTMVLVDSVVRLIPGVINPDSLIEESYGRIQNSENSNQNKKSLVTSYQLPITSYEHPQYTRPAKYKNWQVPEVLLSGNHAEIAKWRKKK